MPRHAKQLLFRRKQRCPGIFYLVQRLKGFLVVGRGKVGIDQPSACQPGIGAAGIVVEQLLKHFYRLIERRIGGNTHADAIVVEGLGCHLTVKIHGRRTLECQTRPVVVGECQAGKSCVQPGILRHRVVGNGRCRECLGSLGVGTNGVAGHAKHIHRLPLGTVGHTAIGGKGFCRASHVTLGV